MVQDGDEPSYGCLLQWECILVFATPAWLKHMVVLKCEKEYALTASTETDVPATATAAIRKHGWAVGQLVAV